MRICHLLLLATVVSAPVPAQSPDSTSGSRGRQVSVPQQLGPFKLARQQRYDDPAMGTMFRYLSPDTVPVDVFIYPGPDFGDACPMECAVKAIDAETKGFRDGFPLMLERGYVDSIAVTAEDTLLPDSSDAWKIGRGLQMRVVRDGDALRSDFVVWYLPTYRVKLRATYPDREPIRAYVRFFTDTLIESIIERSRIAERNRPFAMSVTLAGAPATHLDTVAASLRSLGYVIEDSSVAAPATWLQTAPRTDWTGSAMLERYGADASPALQLLAAFEPKGDSTVVRLMARRVPNGEDPNDDAAQQMSLMAVMEVLSTFTKKEP
jgi:hypothetical protein